MPPVYQITNYRTPDPQHGGVLPHHHDGEQWRALGCLAPKPDRGGLPRFADHFPVIKRSEWRPINYAGFSIPIMNQGQHGSCVGHGAAGAHWKARLMAGFTNERFSPCFVYALGNGGRDAGMIISDSLDILMRDGNCLEEEVPEGRIWRNQVPQQAYTTAKRFRVAAAYHLGSFDEIVTALLLGYLPVYGVYVGADFSNLDQEGVAPAYPGVTGNHCMFGDGLSRLSDGTWAIEDINSWGEQWGLQGRCKLVEDHFRLQNDAYCITGFHPDPQEANEPPVLKGAA
jgi:hypothetical protein